MKHRIIHQLLMAVALSTVMAAAHATLMPITYGFQFDDAGSTLRGTITTDGTLDAPLGFINLSSWTAIATSSTGGPEFSVSGNVFSGYDANSISSTSAGLFFRTPASGQGELFQLLGDGGAIAFGSYSGPSRFYARWRLDPGLFLTGVTVLASAPGASVRFATVPEPATALLLLSALAFRPWKPTNRSARQHGNQNTALA